MRRIVLAAATAATLFTGCANNGLAINTISNNKVDRYFQKGNIISQRKCIIDERATATLTGAGLGAATGAVASGNAKGALIGGILGSIAGAVIGKEITAYETKIKTNGGKTYKGYLKQKLPLNSQVEFTIENGKLKNVNVLHRTIAPKPKTNHYSLVLQPKKEVKRPKPIVVKRVKGVIVKRQKIGNKWDYKLVTLNHRVYQFRSPHKYPYLRDLVELDITNTNNIADIKLLKREQMNLVAAKPEPKKAPEPKLPPKQQQKPKTKTVTIPKTEPKTKSPEQKKAPEKTNKKRNSIW